MTVRMVHRKVALSVFTLFLVHGSTRSTKVFPLLSKDRTVKWFLTRAPLRTTQGDARSALRWRTTSQTAIRAKTLCKNWKLCSQSCNVSCIPYFVAVQKIALSVVLLIILPYALHILCTSIAPCLASSIFIYKPKSIFELGNSAFQHWQLLPPRPILHNRQSYHLHLHTGCVSEPTFTLNYEVFFPSKIKHAMNADLA